ncbi:uncharacterized protein B0I36DRAFT_330930 [Microdochium trichocladiopsis]|uniref:Uncharacterized protein n=1 Tax=Microdochium trichocladiopsis TaxID=1682393 RepID=A0A9P8Y3M9_9PEZI|nr:uncharacterized protein B0I36DRAFT_330930 [Microdochium trichocladiopsis]KAH7026573.1 hypothetical protein B0I36DRAFT_330930 [Microdochium trichocladiopsis]
MTVYLARICVFAAAAAAVADNVCLFFLIISTIVLQIPRLPPSPLSSCNTLCARMRWLLVGSSSSCFQLRFYFPLVFSPASAPSPVTNERARVCVGVGVVVSPKVSLGLRDILRHALMGPVSGIFVGVGRVCVIGQLKSTIDSRCDDDDRRQWSSDRRRRALMSRRK